MIRVGIVGLGFVGGAVRAAGEYCDELLVATCDIDPAKKADTTDPLDLIRYGCDVIFVCVPTPMRHDGSCNWHTVEAVIRRLNEAKDGDPITIIIKSTIPPGTTTRLQDSYPHHNLVFNPEFLTEVAAKADFRAQGYYLMGAPRGPTALDPVVRMYLKLLPTAMPVAFPVAAVEMAKYATNCFLAMKVTFANEMARLCTGMGIEYEQLAGMLWLDTRLGKTHWAVPGPDGKPGFGGSCFPKDLHALLVMAAEAECPVPVLQAVWDENLVNRGEPDWMLLKGRAVE